MPILYALVLMLVAVPAFAKKTPEDLFKGQIILATQPFPRQFASDSAMVAHLKKVAVKGFRYDEKGTIDVEFMAFFARAHTTTEFTGTIYDVTEGQKLVSTFPVYPGQRETRILQSGFSLTREKYPSERRYMLVITTDFRGAIIAEVNFALQRPVGEKDAKVEPTVVDMR